MRGLKKVIQKKLFIYLGNMIELPPLLSMVFDNGNMILPGSIHVNRIFAVLCMFFTDRRMKTGLPGIPDGGIVPEKKVCTCFPVIFCRKWNSGVINHEL